MPLLRPGAFAVPLTVSVTCCPLCSLAVSCGVLLMLLLRTDSSALRVGGPARAASPLRAPGCLWSARGLRLWCFLRCSLHPDRGDLGLEVVGRLEGAVDAGE